MDTCGTLIIRNVNLGRTFFLCFGNSFGHDTLINHLVKIRQTVCSCTVINFRNQLEGTLHKLRQRLRAAAARLPTCWVIWLVTSAICGLAEGRFNCRNQTINDGDTDRAAALLTTSHRAVEIASCGREA